jgi:hypothetical protein
MKTHLSIAAALFALAIPPSASAQDQNAVPAPPAEQAPPVVTNQAPPQTYPQAVYTAPPYAGYPQPYYVAQPYMGRAGRPPIVGYRTEQRPTTALWAAGLAAFLAGWVLDFAVLTPIANAVSNDRSEAVEQDAWAWSLVPIVGPWIQLGLGAPHPAIPITTGILQLAGVGMFIAGMLWQQEVRVPIYQGDPDDPNMRRVDVSLRPELGGGTLALAYRHR